jgi:hypothetical protein
MSKPMKISEILPVCLNQIDGNVKRHRQTLKEQFAEDLKKVDTEKLKLKEKGLRNSQA